MSDKLPPIDLRPGKEFRFRGRIATIEQNALAYHNILVEEGMDREAAAIRNYFDPNILGSSLNDLTNALTAAMFASADAGKSKLFELGLSIYDPSFELPPDCVGMLPHPHNQWGFEPLGLIVLDTIKRYHGPRGWTLPTQPESEELGMLLLEGHFNLGQATMNLRIVFANDPEISLWSRKDVPEAGQELVDTINEVKILLASVPEAEIAYHEAAKIRDEQAADARADADENPADTPADSE